MTDTSFGELTPEESSFFESGGTSPIPTGDKTAATSEAAPEKTEAKTEGEKAAEAEAKVEKMVSLSALHEERARRRQIDAEFRKTQQELAELRGKFSIIDRIGQPAEPEAPITPETDIFGYTRKTGETVEQLQKRLDERDRAEKETAERTKIVNAYRNDAAQFEAKTPDFKAAYNHLLQSRMAELQAMGYDDPQQLHEALQADEMAIAQMALSRGKSAAETLYQLAQQRGYRKADDKPQAAAKIETIERGQAANKSLSNTGGSAGEVEMTGEMLVKMPPDEFEAWVAKNPAKARRIMGG